MHSLMYHTFPSLQSVPNSLNVCLVAISKFWTGGRGCVDTRPGFLKSLHQLCLIWWNLHSYHSNLSLNACIFVYLLFLCFERERDVVRTQNPSVGILTSIKSYFMKPKFPLLQSVTKSHNMLLFAISHLWVEGSGCEDLRPGFWLIMTCSMKLMFPSIQFVTETLDVWNSQLWTRCGGSENIKLGFLLFYIEYEIFDKTYIFITGICYWKSTCSPR